MIESFLFPLPPSSFRCCRSSSTSFRGVSSYDDEMLFDDNNNDNERLLLVLEQLSIAQLKQQIRLRRTDHHEDENNNDTDILQSNNRQELIAYLMQLVVASTTTTSSSTEDLPEVLPNDKTTNQKDTDDNNTDDNNTDNTDDTDTTTETWGDSARVVEDYEGRSIVVDGLSRSRVEYNNNNQAYVVASKEALQQATRIQTTTHNTTTPNNIRTLLTQQVQQIQLQREQQAGNTLPKVFPDQVDNNQGDENGIFDSILQRDYSDWGTHSVTGAQVASTQQLTGLLLLSDDNNNHTTTRALADKIAFECQPIVVMVPDLLSQQKTVHYDIRAAAACLRQHYAVTSIALWGTSWGGGRALEAAVGYPFDRSTTTHMPPPVHPSVVVAWYPTEYNATALFGTQLQQQQQPSFAAMALFAGDDTLPGATPKDAQRLKQLWEQSEQLKDSMVKVFPNQSHGFAHLGLLSDDTAENEQEYSASERFINEEFGGTGRVGLMDGDAEVATLLSTAFMETYSRAFLPTTGPPIRKDDSATEWTNNIEMKDLSSIKERDVRAEIEEALDDFVEEPLGGHRINPTDPDDEDELLKLLKRMEEPSQKAGPYAIEEDDDLTTVYAKLKAADPDFQLF